METSEAIVSFSESEKIKSGLVWATHLVEMLESVPQGRREAAEQVVETLLAMIGHETQIVRNITRDTDWEQAELSINMAIVMIRSKVAEESRYHISNAISRVTNLGQRAMTFLKDEKLL